MIEKLLFSNIVNKLLINKMIAMKKIRSEAAGTVWKLEVAVGQSVVEGDVLLIVESMKMEIPVCASASGVVTELWIVEGDMVSDDQVIAVIS